MATKCDSVTHTECNTCRYWRQPQKSTNHTSKSAGGIWNGHILHFR